jgi:predicted RNA-binding Zn ribbon-like protein
VSRDPWPKPPVPWRAKAPPPGGWVARPKGQPGNRPPAPGGLARIQAFVNTANPELEDDLLATTDWFGRDAHVDLRRAVAVREALRAMLAHHGGAPFNPRAARTLDTAARRARITLRVADDGTTELRSADPLGALLAIVHRAEATGTWPRLKVCKRCGWAFYDASRNRSSRWCSMQVCGGRVKRRAYRRRRAR